MSAHITEWTLRRLHVGELPAPEATQARAHVAGCTACGAVLKEVEDAQSRFEAEVPFERFAAQVERATTRQPAPRRPQWERAARPLAAMAATVLVLVGVGRFMALEDGTEPRGNRIKGGAVAELRIGGDGPQRTAGTERPEPMAPGERVRLGYEAGAHRYVMAVSVDARGEVTPLYPETGESLSVEPGPGMHWLPDSLEFTGSGAERVVLVLSDTPLKVDAVTSAARDAFEAGGRDVAHLPELDVPGEQTHWMLLKP